MEFYVKQEAQKVIEKELKKRKSDRVAQVRQQSIAWTEERRRRFQEEKEKQIKFLTERLTGEAEKGVMDKLETLAVIHDLALGQVGAAHREAASLPDFERLKALNKLREHEIARKRGALALREELHGRAKESQTLIRAQELRQQVREAENRKSKELVERRPFSATNTQKIAEEVATTKHQQKLADLLFIPYGKENGQNQKNLKRKYPAAAATAKKIPPPVIHSTGRFAKEAEKWTSSRSTTAKSILKSPLRKSPKSKPTTFSPGREMTSTTRKFFTSPSMRTPPSKSPQSPPRPRTSFMSPTVSAVNKAKKKPASAPPHDKQLHQQKRKYQFPAAILGTAVKGTAKVTELKADKGHKKPKSKGHGEVQYYDASMPKVKATYIAPKGLVEREEGEGNAWENAIRTQEELEQESQQRQNDEHKLNKLTDIRGKKAMKKAKAEQELKQVMAQIDDTMTQSPVAKKNEKVDNVVRQAPDSTASSTGYYEPSPTSSPETTLKKLENRKKSIDSIIKKFTTQQDNWKREDGQRKTPDEIVAELKAEAARKATLLLQVTTEEPEKPLPITKSPAKHESTKKGIKSTKVQKQARQVNFTPEKKKEKKKVTSGKKSKGKKGQRTDRDRSQSPASSTGYYSPSEGSATDYYSPQHPDKLPSPIYSSTPQSLSMSSDSKNVSVSKAGRILQHYIKKLRSRRHTSIEKLPVSTPTSLESVAVPTPSPSSSVAHSLESSRKNSTNDTSTSDEKTTSLYRTNKSFSSGSDVTIHKSVHHIPLDSVSEEPTRDVHDSSSGSTIAEAQIRILSRHDNIITDDETIQDDFSLSSQTTENSKEAARRKLFHEALHQPYSGSSDNGKSDKDKEINRTEYIGHITSYWHSPKSTRPNSATYQTQFISNTFENLRNELNKMKLSPMSSILDLEPEKL